VQSGKVVKTLFFDHGRIVFAASNLKKDRLGEALVALGRITEEQFRKASAVVVQDRNKRFGEALVSAGILDKQEVGRSVARQVKRIVLSLFPFADGVATFDERSCPVPLEYMVSLSVHRVLYDGIQTMDKEPLVLAGLGDLDRRVKLAPVAPFEFNPGEARKDEVEILEQAQRRSSIRRLAWMPGGLSFPRLRTTYALVASGLLVDADKAEDAQAQPVIHMETGTFLLSALRRQPDPTGAEAVRKEVAQELENSAHLDRESWLRVSRSAPREELIRALEEKMERYHALREATGEDDAVRTDIEVILGRVSAMLRLARQTPEEPSVPAPAAAPSAPAPEPPPPPAASAPAPPSVASSSAAGTSNFAGNAQIEHLLMEAEVRMTVSDYANAIKVYAKLVEVAPNIASYRARLAIAMASYPKTAKQAEREFLEATRLDPDNADIHYQFGMYYKIMKQRARALAEMQTAVRLNRRHALARKEMESLGKEGGPITISLKKLFK
jgi:tetratricopeptide (TPR) repeat protein